MSDQRQSAEKDAPANCWSRPLCRLMGHDPCCYLPASFHPTQGGPDDA